MIGVHRWGSGLRQRLWWIEALRGGVTLAFGIAYLAFHIVFYLLITFFGIYLMFDGCLDVLRIVRGRHGPRRHLSLYLGALASSTIGLFCLLDPQILLIFMSLILLSRLIVRGMQVFGEARRRQGLMVSLYWLYGVLLIVLGLICLLPAVFVYVPLVLASSLGIYALGDGLYMLGRALYLAWDRTAPKRREVEQRLFGNLLDIPASSPPTTRRALVFVRRSGARGLGHVGWAFEWENGWWNVGSLENYSSHAFAPAGQADFWTAHTTHPIATMFTRVKPYDEYKIFFIAEPQPKLAWKVLTWASHQPYQVVHRNCIDTTYDILRTYGLSNLPDPITEYEPNDWYDSLAGYSFPIKAYTTLPIHLHRFSTRPLPVEEIGLDIPPTQPGTIPPWRATGNGLRGLIELLLIAQKMFHDVKHLVTLHRLFRQQAAQQIFIPPQGEEVNLTWLARRWHAFQRIFRVF